MWVTSSSFMKTLRWFTPFPPMVCVSRTPQSWRSGTVACLVPATVFPPRHCVWCRCGPTQALPSKSCFVHELLLCEALLPGRKVSWDNIFRSNKKSPQPQLKGWDSSLIILTCERIRRASPWEVCNNFFPCMKNEWKSSKTSWSTHYLRSHQPLPVGNEKLQKV